MKLPKCVSGYTEFTSFSAKMNEHDGSAVRYTKQVRAGVSSLANFHKLEGRGYINDRVGAYEQPTRIWFKILNFRSWLDEGPTANYGNDSLGRIINHFAGVVDQQTK